MRHLGLKILLFCNVPVGTVVTNETLGTEDFLVARIRGYDRVFSL